MDSLTAAYACQSVCHESFYHMDHDNVDAALAVFTADAVFHRHGEELRGHEQIRRMLAGRGKRPLIHAVCNFVVLARSETTISASAYVLSMRTLEGPAVNGVRPTADVRALEFLDDYRLTPDGWRIAARRANALLPGIVWHDHP